MFAIICLFFNTIDSDHPVRLIGGRNSSEGRIEVFDSGEWGVVCSDFFDNNDAVVVCKQLGFSGVEEIVDVAVFGGGGPVVLDDLSCTGNEDELADCGSITWRFHNCLYPKDVGLICSELYSKEHLQYLKNCVNIKKLIIIMNSFCVHY